MQLPSSVTTSQLYRELAAAGQGFMSYARGQTNFDGTPRGFSQPAVASGPQAAQNWVDQARQATETLQQRITNTGRNGTYSPSGVDFRSREFRRTAEQLENVVHGNSIRNLEASYGRSRAAYESTLNPRQLEELQRIAPDMRYAAQQARAASIPTPTQARPNSVDYTPAHQTPRTANAGGALNAIDQPRTGSPSSWQRFERIYNAPPGTPAQRIARATPELPLGSARPRSIFRRFAGTGVGVVYAFSDLATRVWEGQDYGSAAMTAVLTAGGGEAGALLGASIGAVAGPPGIVLGGLVGGALGAGLGSTLGDQLTELGRNMGIFPRPARAPEVPRSYQTGPPFRGGQTTNAYNVSVRTSWTFESGFKLEGESGFDLWGPIRFSGRYTRNGSYIVGVYSFGAAGVPRKYLPELTEFSVPDSRYGREINGPTLRRLDGVSEANDILQSTGQHPLIDNPREGERSPGTRNHPANDRDNRYYPGSIPAGGTQRGDAPGWVPAARLAPSIEPPQPNLGRDLPTVEPARTPQQPPNEQDGDRVAPTTGPGAAPAGGGGGLGSLPPLAPAALGRPVRSDPGPTGRRQTPPIDLPQGSGSGQPPAPPADPGSPCRGNRCGQRQLEAINRNGELLNNLLNAGQTIDLASINTKLDQINAKLGDQIPGGGIAKFLKSLWDSLNLQRVINLLTFITTLHNAYWLSNAISQTLFSAFDNVLQLFGFQLKNAEGEQISTGEWIGDSIEGFFNSIFGTERVDGIQATWKSFSRIYQAAANIINSLQSIAFSILESLEVVGNYVALIGNASKKFGVFAENCYKWMNPNLDFTRNRFFNALENVSEATEAIEQVTSELVSIQETSRELSDQRDELNRAVAGLGRDGTPVDMGASPYSQVGEVVSVAVPEQAARTASSGANISASDLTPPPTSE